MIWIASVTFRGINTISYSLCSQVATATNSNICNTSALHIVESQRVFFRFVFVCGLFWQIVAAAPAGFFCKLQRSW